MFHWLLVAPQALKSVLPVVDSFSNEEMRTFCRIRAHQSTSETINTNLWRRKTKPASIYFAVVVLATNKTCGAFPLTSFWIVEHRGLKVTFHHNVKENLFHFSTNISAFLPIHWLTRDRYRCLQWCISHLICRVFRWCFLTLFCDCNPG